MTTLLLLNEDVENPDFMRIVWEALRKLLPEASAEEVAAMVKVLVEQKADGDSEQIGDISREILQ